MTGAVGGRLDRLERRHAPRTTFVVAVEDEVGALWQWDGDRPAPVDPAALPPGAQLVVIGTRKDGPP